MKRDAQIVKLEAEDSYLETEIIHRRDEGYHSREDVTLLGGENNQLKSNELEHIDKLKAQFEAEKDTLKSRYRRKAAGLARELAAYAAIINGLVRFLYRF